MQFDEEDDERVVPGPFPSPDDRLWRHPSEIGPPPPPGGSGRVARPFGRGALLGACLAGAVVAVGAMWLARPTRVVERQAEVSSRSGVAAPAVPEVTRALVHRQLADDFAGRVALLRIERDGRWSDASALWVDEHGTLATAAPLVDGATSLIVVGTDREPQVAVVAGVDQGTGLAALAVTRTAGTVVRSTGRPPGPGDQVAVVGAGGPRSGVDVGDPTVSAVVVRAVGQRATVAGNLLHGTIELDRPLPADTSGGAVVDGGGELVGLVLGSSERDLATAVDAATVLATAADLRAHGRVERAWLGVQATDLPPDRASILEVTGGALLTQVDGGSPAQAAGLQVDDVVLAVADHGVDDASDLVMALRQLAPGDPVVVEVVRDGQALTSTVVLGG